MRLTTLIALLMTATLAASDTYPPPRFIDPARVAKLQSAMPEIDRIFRAYAADTKIPGMVWGVVIDGRLAHVDSVGVRERADNSPKQSAPQSAMLPEINQTTRIQRGEPRDFAIPAGVRKIPMATTSPMSAEVAVPRPN
jgi:hypothetical protein